MSLAKEQIEKDKYLCFEGENFKNMLLVVLRHMEYLFPNTGIC